jgi:copper chaperone CopZ
MIVKGTNQMKSISAILFGIISLVSFSAFASGTGNTVQLTPSPWGAMTLTSTNDSTKTTTAHEVPAPGVQQAVFSVKGMMCSSCAKNVTSALKNVKGVQTAKVDRKKNLAMVSYDNRTTTTDSLIKAISEAGYTAKLAP